MLATEAILDQSKTGKKARKKARKRDNQIKAHEHRFHSPTVEDLGPHQRAMHVESVVTRDGRTVNLGPAVVLREREIQEGGIVTSTGSYNRYETALDKLKHAGDLDGGPGHPNRNKASSWRRDAGLKLRKLAETRGIGSRQTFNWSPTGGLPPDEQTDQEAANEMAYMDALALLGPYKDVVVKVCVDGMMPPSNTSWHEALRRGLDLLAEHWRISDPDPRLRRSTRKGTSH